MMIIKIYFSFYNLKEINCYKKERDKFVIYNPVRNDNGID